MNIGDKILELRKAKGYSQEDIANKLNVSRQTVSKWETNQSTPDFDKIVPLCKLFEISTDELLMNKSSNESDKVMEDTKLNCELNESNNRRKFAFSLCVAIFMYFLSVMWIIFGEAIGIDDDINVVIFLGIAGLATVVIIYASIVNKDSKKEKIKKDTDKPIVKSINSILGLVFFIIYMIVSFETMAWHITWIIWVIYAVVEEIVKLVFKLGEKNE